MLVVITHENFDLGKIYASTYFMMIRSPNSPYYDVSTALGSLQASYITDFCNYMFSLGEDAWENPTET